MSVDDAIRETTPEQLELWSLRESPSHNLGFWKDYVSKLAFEYVLNIFDHSIGQGHDGQVVGIITKRIFNL